MVNLVKSTINGVEVVNLTPHVINLYKEDGSIINIPPSGVIAIVETKEFLYKKATELLGVNVFTQNLGYLSFKDNLNNKTLDYLDGFSAISSAIPITSAMARERLSDLLIDSQEISCLVLSPDTGKGAVRDEGGQIIGTKGFVSSGSL
jgi:hypothetical protein